jgi:hypothetical protein
MQVLGLSSLYQLPPFLQESTLILDPVALTWTLSLPTEQSPKASVRKRTRVAASSSRFSLRLGGSEALCLAEIANAGLRDLSGSGVSVPLPAPNIYGGKHFDHRFEEPQWTSKCPVVCECYEDT